MLPPIVLVGAGRVAQALAIALARRGVAVAAIGSRRQALGPGWPESCPQPSSPQAAVDQAGLVLLTVLAWGAVAFGNVPGLQVYVVRQAQRVAPNAVDVASGLNIAAFNLGIAGGAWLGGQVVAHLGLIHTTWVGALVVLGAWALTAWSGRLDRARDDDGMLAEPASCR